MPLPIRTPPPEPAVLLLTVLLVSVMGDFGIPPPLAPSSAEIPPPLPLTPATLPLMVQLSMLTRQPYRTAKPPPDCPAVLLLSVLFCRFRLARALPSTIAPPYALV